MQTAPARAPLRIDSATGLLTGARQVLSPHCDARPAGLAPELLVVHGISLPPGEFGGPWIDRLFTGTLPAEAHPYFREVAATRVSAHALIRRDGEIVQYVPFGERAWHAGASQYRGRPACNDFSVGVELEGTDDTPYTEVQYQRLAALAAALLASYASLSAEAIVGHSDIAPGRKTDPGASFDWPRWRALLQQRLVLRF
jgi:N-acetyl-anhydromuramoyl-L-alanine amidase